MIGEVAAQYVTIQDPVKAYGPTITKSPCRGCNHANEDKNICKTFADCPIKIPAVLTVEEARAYRFSNKVMPLKDCKCPGCDNKVRSASGYCKIHQSRVKTFVKNFGVEPPPEFIALPVEKKGRRGNLVDVFIDMYGYHPAE